MSLKILHTGDLHLGMKFAGYDGEAQDKLVEARFECLSRLVAAANEHDCELLVVAGDLFDRVTVAKRDILRAAAAIDDFEGAAAVILPGNHDYVGPDGSELWRTFSEAAGGRVLVTDRARPYSLVGFDIDATIYPGPCGAKHSSENAVGWIAAAERSADVKHHLGLAHGSVEGVSPDFDGRYYPMTIAELRSLGLDLWLLGHTHSPYPPIPGPGDNIFFAGTPEPDGFDCAHSGSAWVHELSDGTVRSRQIATGRYRFEHATANLGGDADLRRIEASYAAETSNGLLLKLKLEGRLPPESYERLGQVEAAVAARVLDLRWDDSAVTRQITRADIEEAYTEGSFPHRLLSALARSEDDFEALQKAHQIIEELRQ